MSLCRFWNAKLAKYARRGRGEEALRLYRNILAIDSKPNRFIIASVLCACVSLGSCEGKQIHAHSVKHGLQSDLHIGTTLIHMYSRFGLLQDAQQMFDKMSERNVVSYTAMMVGYVHNRMISAETWNVFKEMQLTGTMPNSKSLAIILRSCECPRQAEQIHGFSVKVGLECSSLSVGNTLVSVYAKFGSIQHAYKVFDLMSELDIITWNAMISGCCHCNRNWDVLLLFQKMVASGFCPDPTTFASVLSSCATLDSPNHGKQVHAQAIKFGFGACLTVENALISMYSKTNLVEDSDKVFKKMAKTDIVSWNAMLGGYVENNLIEEGFKHFHEMHQTIAEMDHITYSCMLSSCKGPETLEQGKQLHGHTIVTGFESHKFVQSSLITMYADCGNVGEANKLFAMMPEKDLDCWNAMIAGYARNGFGESSLKLFHQMQQLGMGVDNFTFASVVSASANLAALEAGKQIHTGVIKSGYISDIFVETSLIDLYAKCGLIDAACQIFDSISEQTDLAYEMMISAYAIHGNAGKSLEVFEQMKVAGIRPYHGTFVSLLSACSHAGMVDASFSLFHSMQHEHGIVPKLEHYACMVDAFGRSGRLYEAVEFIERMPLQPNSLVWRSLLSACKMHGNMNIGRYAAEQLIKMEPCDPAAHVLLSNIYANKNGIM